jgi:hypothetical protein
MDDYDLKKKKGRHLSLYAKKSDASPSEKLQRLSSNKSSFWFIQSSKIAPEILAAKLSCIRLTIFWDYTIRLTEPRVINHPDKRASAKPCSIWVRQILKIYVRG